MLRRRPTPLMDHDDVDAIAIRLFSVEETDRQRERAGGLSLT